MKVELVVQLILAMWGVAWLGFIGRLLWKTWRTHRAFEAVMKEVDRADEKMRQAKTVEELNARYERVQELLEHAATIAKR